MTKILSNKINFINFLIKNINKKTNRFISFKKIIEIQIENFSVRLNNLEVKIANLRDNYQKTTEYDDIPLVKINNFLKRATIKKFNEIINHLSEKILGINSKKIFETASFFIKNLWPFLTTPTQNKKTRRYPNVEERKIETKIIQPNYYYDKKDRSIKKIVKEEINKHIPNIIKKTVNYIENENQRGFSANNIFAELY